jgi:hypothetical protein
MHTCLYDVYDPDTRKELEAGCEVRYASRISREIIGALNFSLQAQAFPNLNQYNYNSSLVR